MTIIAMQGLLAASAGWSPSQVPGIAGWYVADNPANVLSSGELSQLADRSGNGNTAPALSGSSNRALLVPAGLDGRTIWRTDAANKRGFFNPALAAISNGVAGLTLAVLHRTNPALGAADANILRLNTNAVGTARAMIGRGSYGSNAVYAGGRRLDANSFDYAADTSDRGNSWLILVASFDYAAAQLVLSVNGTTYVDAAFQSPGSAQGTNSSSVGLGHNGIGSTGSAAYGDYAEALVAASAVSTGDRQRIEGYLAWQWGLEANLPSGHPYELVSP